MITGSFSAVYRIKTTNILFCNDNFVRIVFILSPVHDDNFHPLRDKDPYGNRQDVTVRSTDGSTVVIGQVVALPQTTRWPSYASAWGTPGKYRASLLNAVHDACFCRERKRSLSIIPRETIASLLQDLSICGISSTAGNGIFTGGLSCRISPSNKRRYR